MLFAKEKYAQMYAQQYVQHSKTNKKCRVKPPPPCTEMLPIRLPFSHRLNTFQTPFKRPLDLLPAIHLPTPCLAPMSSNAPRKNTPKHPHSGNSVPSTPHIHPFLAPLAPFLLCRPQFPTSPHSAPQKQKSEEKQPRRHLSSLLVQPNSTSHRSIFTPN